MIEKIVDIEKGGENKKQQHRRFDEEIVFLSLK